MSSFPLASYALIQIVNNVQEMLQYVLNARMDLECKAAHVCLVIRVYVCDVEMIAIFVHTVWMDMEFLQGLVDNVSDVLYPVVAHVRRIIEYAQAA